jgi:hypothetical protein
MEEPAHPPVSPVAVLRVVLAAFVLLWLFGPYSLRSAIPIWLPFLIALGLELHFFLGAFRPGRARQPDRGPQSVDRERFGDADEPGELLVVHREGDDLWIPYSGETGDELEALLAEPPPDPAAEDELEASLEEPQRPRLPVRRFLAGLAVIGGLAALLWLVDSRTGWDGLAASTRADAAQRFSDEASRIAAKPVTIRCDSAGDYVGAVQHADGVAAVGGSLAYLTPERCLDLYRLAFEYQVTWSQTARAIAVLAHEAWHLRGISDEGTTECYALQSGVTLGQRLGLSEGTARRMMRQQLTENATRSGAGVEYRVPSECRDGGRLDLDPRSHAFP